MILERYEKGRYSLMLVLSFFSIPLLSVTVQADDKPHYKASRSASGLVVTGQAVAKNTEIVEKKTLNNASALKVKQALSRANNLASSGRLPPHKVSGHMLDNSSASTQYTLETTADDRVKVYQYQDNNGVVVFTDHAPGSREYQVILYDCYACRPDSDLDWKKMPLYSKRFDDLIQRAAKNYQLEPALIRAVIHAESAFDIYAISKTGAMGLMQLMPDTAKELGVKDAFKPAQNIDGGAKYLAKMLSQFNGDIELACAAYNAGPTTVTQYQGIPPYPETIAYVERVKILLKRYQQLG